MSNHQLHSQLLFISPLVLFAPLPAARIHIQPLSLSPSLSHTHKERGRGRGRESSPLSTSVVAVNQKAGFKKSFPFVQVSRIKHVTVNFNLSLQISTIRLQIILKLTLTFLRLELIWKTSDGVWRSVRGLILARSPLSLLLFPDQIFLNSKTTCSLKVCLKPLLVQKFRPVRLLHCSAMSNMNRGLCLSSVASLRSSYRPQKSVKRCSKILSVSTGTQTQSGDKPFFHESCFDTGHMLEREINWGKQTVTDHLRRWWSVSQRCSRSDWHSVPPNTWRRAGTRVLFSQRSPCVVVFVTLIAIGSSYLSYLHLEGNLSYLVGT